MAVVALKYDNFTFSLPFRFLGGLVTELLNHWVTDVLFLRCFIVVPQWTEMYGSNQKGRAGTHLYLPWTHLILLVDNNSFDTIFFLRQTHRLYVSTLQQFHDFLTTGNLVNQSPSTKNHYNCLVCPYISNAKNSDLCRKRVWKKKLQHAPLK